MNGIDYIPRADGAFDTWQLNYVGYAISHSRELELSHADVAALEDAQTGWHKDFGELAEARAWLDSIITSKDLAREHFEQLIRRISGQIQKNPVIDNAQRAALGLTIADTTRSLIPPPQTVPQLSIDAGQRRLHRIRFVDSASLLRRGKPKGAIGIDLRLCLTLPGEPIPSDPARYVFLQLATRSPARVEFSGENAGKMASYMARWLNARAEPGPWGDIASATVGG